MRLHQVKETKKMQSKTTAYVAKGGHSITENSRDLKKGL
jgi:hypothetical protein